MAFNDSGSAFGPGGGSPVRQLANLWMGKQFLGGDRDRRPSGGSGQMRKRDWKNLSKYQKYMYELEDTARRRAAGTHVDAYGKTMDIETQHIGKRGQMETEELGRRGAAETEEYGKRSNIDTQAYGQRGEIDVDVHGRKTKAETEAQRERMDINVGGEKTSLQNQSEVIMNLAQQRQEQLGGPQFPQQGAAAAAPAVDEGTKKKRSESGAKAAETRKRRQQEAADAGEPFTPLRPTRPRKPKAETPAAAPAAPEARPTSVRQEEPTLMGGAPGQQRGSIGGAVNAATYTYDQPKKD